MSNDRQVKKGLILLLKHRSDIDGLRSLAVLPIVFFHAGIESLQGGFIGVDIFFVISGFLITSIILGELKSDSFSILKFYHRRVIRILPALLCMLILVTISGCLIMFSQELQGLMTSAMASAGFISNIYFWKTASYFALSSESKPLLHTWSLGIEEQFYIFFPLLLAACFRWARRQLSFIVVVITACSFFVSWWATSAAPGAAFYLLPSRAWELGIGACVALGLLPAIQSSTIRAILSLLGGAMILVGIILISADVGFPAPAALLPCLGTALLIGFGEDGPTAKALSCGPAVWLGKISYSVYLWHWPIITFFRLSNGSQLSGLQSGFLIAASIAAGAISYYVIEQPFQRHFRAKRSASVVRNGLIIIVFYCIVSAAVYVNARRIVVLPKSVTQVADFIDYPGTAEHIRQTDYGRCFTGEGAQFNIDRCFTIDKQRRNVLLLGDSHAAQYRDALANQYKDIHFVQITVSGCRPLVRSSGELRCTQVMREILSRRLPNSPIRDVILAGRWTSEETSKVVETIHELHNRGINVTVVGPTVEYGGDFPLLLARQTLNDSRSDMARFVKHDRFDLDDVLKKAVQSAGATYWSEIKAECPKGSCRLFTRDGTPYHIDYGHLTRPAAKEVISRMTIP